MEKVNDVVDYIILQLTADGEENHLSNLKLQKLLYYVQAWHLGIYKQPLFKDSFMAWVHGPVCGTIYDRFKNNKTLYSLINREDVINKNPMLNKDSEKHIDYILNNYAQYGGVDLEIMTHNELPWIKARGNCSKFDYCTNTITENSMIEYYGKRWAEINADS